MRVHLIFCLSLAFAVPAVGCMAQAPLPEEAAKPAAKAPPKGAKVEVPNLPPEKLPPLSGSPPDPAREQYRRERVYVHVAERVQPKERPPYSPEPRVLENYLAEYFRRAGFEVVSDPAAATYRVDGSFEARFFEAIVFQSQTLAHKYQGQVKVVLRQKEGGPELEKVEIPEFYTEGVQIPPEEAKKRNEQEDTRAVHIMRRHLAKNVWEMLYHGGKTLGDPEIPALISSLALDDPDNEAPVQARDILKALAAKKMAAVPYLLDALTDERPVRVIAQYPGLTALNSDKLRIYHLADKALEEIFQKVSRLDLEMASDKRFLIIKGWQNEWKRFCPSYRDSPQAKESPRARSGEAGGKKA